MAQGVVDIAGVAHHEVPASGAFEIAGKKRAVIVLGAEIRIAGEAVVHGDPLGLRLPGEAAGDPGEAERLFQRGSARQNT